MYNIFRNLDIFRSVRVHTIYLFKCGGRACRAVPLSRVALRQTAGGDCRVGEGEGVCVDVILPKNYFTAVVHHVFRHVSNAYI